MNKTLEEKLRTLRAYHAADVFILADARDPDMAWGVLSPGMEGGRPRTMPQFHEQVRAVVAQGEVDLVLASASTMGRLAHEEKLFEKSRVTPAVRMNDTTDIWLPRGGRYAAERSAPFSTTTFEEAMYGTAAPAAGEAARVRLGLYSVTFNNNLAADLRTLEAFRAFRLEAQKRGFAYILEVFAPNAGGGLTPEQVPGYMNDQICRMLAGIPAAGRPAFLKIPYAGPRALEELAAYDPSVVVGILGGSSGTTMESFSMLYEAKRHGARAALFGRRIKEAEDPLAFIAMMRRVVEGMGPAEAVRAYHDQLRARGVAPRRRLEEDLVRGPA